MRRRWPHLALLVGLLWGCGGVAFRLKAPPEPQEAASPAASAAPSQPPAPPRAPKSEDAALESALQFIRAQQQSYKLSPADLLEVTIYQENDLNRKVRVSPEGIISLPLVGRVHVGGLGVADTEDAIREKLTRYLISPQVSVFISEYGNKQVYVLGEVSKPGSYNLPTEAPLSVIEAITLAGGFTQFAAKDRTRVIRHSKEGASEVHLIEVSAITKRGEKAKDMTLKPNDVVFIPESFF